jgi:hypothetical protein
MTKKVSQSYVIIKSLCSSCKHMNWHKSYYVCGKTKKRIKINEVIEKCKYWPPVIVYDV